MKSLVIVLLCAGGALAGVKDGVYTNAELGVRFSAPKDAFVVRSKDMKLGVKGALAEIEGKDGKSAGVLLRFEDKRSAKDHAKWRGKEFEKRAKSCVWEREEKLDRKPGEWLLVEFTVELDDSDLRYVDVIVSRGEDVLELLAWCADGDEGTGKSLESIATSLELGTFEDPGEDKPEEPKEPAEPKEPTEPKEPAEPKEPKEPGGEDKRPPDGPGGNEVRLPNPWKGSGPGSWAKFRLTSEAGDIKQEMEVTQTLVEQDADSYTIKTDTVVGGQTIEGEPQRIGLVQKGGDGESVKPETGEETIKVPKGEFACTWTRTSGAGATTQIWMNDGVPGGVVKTSSEMPGAKTVMELVEFEKK